MAASGSIRRRGALAIDVGGTKLAAAHVVDEGGSGRIVRRATVPTPVTDDPAEVVAALLRVATDAARPDVTGRRAVIDVVGIGSAGPVDIAAGTVSPVNIPAWRAFPIVEAMRAAFPGVPVVLAGDGHCMALGEYWCGGAASRSLLGMVVSTGIGGGVVLDGRIQTGPTGSAGHIGHMTLDPRGPVCPCGGRGCVEAYASGPSMAKWAVANGWVPQASGAQGAALATDARAGDRVALAAFGRAAEAIASAVVCAAALIELDDVVLGGGVVNGAGDLLLDPIRAHVAAVSGLDFVRRVRIGASRLAGDAGLLGAAALGLQIA